MGVECEYHVETGDDTSSVSRYISAKAISKAGILRIGQYLEDGSRLYPDVDHAEYATRESMGPYAAADQDLNGIEVLKRVIEASELPHKGVYRVSGTTLSNATYKKEGYTNGVHENSMFPGSLAGDRVMQGLLMGYLASRHWAMSGNVFQQQYEFSQKISGIGGPAIATSLERATSEGHKPMIAILRGNYDTMHSGDWARGETRFADPGISREARRIVLASHSLIYRLGEQQQRLQAKQKDLDLRDGIFAHPLTVAKRVMGGISLHETFATISGKQFTSLDMQEFYATQALKLAEITSLPPDEIDGAQKWLQTINAWRHSNPKEVQYDKYLIDTYDVVAKHVALHRSDSFRDDSIAKGRSLLWDRVIPEGLGMKYWGKVGHSFDQFSDAPIAASAEARINFIREHNDTALSVNWLYGTRSDGSTERFPLPWGAS